MNCSQVLIEPTLDVDPMVGLAHYSINSMVVTLVNEKLRCDALRLALRHGALCT